MQAETQVRRHPSVQLQSTFRQARMSRSQADRETWTAKGTRAAQAALSLLQAQAWMHQLWHSTQSSADMRP